MIVPSSPRLLAEAGATASRKHGHFGTYKEHLQWARALCAGIAEGEADGEEGMASALATIPFGQGLV
jgi:hypothetical protein